jgi:diguanylate cyclase (GGDEF)-like protein/PAS domain S-box-containing protein
MLVDDNVEIHKDFCKILSMTETDSLEEDEALLFGLTKIRGKFEPQYYRIDSAYQGQDALELVKESVVKNDPYAIAFVDMKMPPGWDGIETIKKLWEVDPAIQMVICSAYSDHSWEDITQELGNSDNLLILKKPFEVIEINQLASALTKKWELIANLQSLVKKRTEELENLYALTQTTLESTQEGILAAGLEEQILMYNQKFLKQWGISEEILKSEKSGTVFQKLAEFVKDPIHFLKIMGDLAIEPKTKDIKEWQLNSGSIFELYAHPQYLHDKINGVVYSFRDITERKTLEKQLLHQATHDALTTLPNRALLVDRINQAIGHAKRFDLRVAVLLLDLDSFKEVNDSYGHKAGDLLLKCQAKRLAEFIRANDTVARLGGDEFVVVLVSQPLETDFVVFLNKLIEVFADPCKIEDHEIISTASIGVSIYPQDGEDVDTLLKNADAALYHAKEMGCNRFQFYMEEFNKRILQKAELKLELAQALHRKELSLDYQPLVDLKTGSIIGIEALLRWNHPTMGIISPMTFIPVAEESGLIIPIGEWVLRNACAQAKIWHDTSAFPFIKISINISVKQFRQRNFVSLIRHVLEETGLKSECLELEITESLIMGSVTDVIEKMLELKNMGVRFAIDDFGTGYSGLSYLKHFPFDTVKIDKTFMDNITTDPNNASIVEAIISMTKNMGIDVLAEGIEHAEQVSFLREHHSNQVQGYYFSQPLSEKDCSALLKTKNNV